VSAVRLDYDLAGTGNAPGLAIRSTKNLSPKVSVEFGGVYGRPAQQFGSSSLFMPEAQVRYRWSVGRFFPYAGAGLGAARVRSDFHTDWDPTMSFSAGAGVQLSDRLAVTGEFRLRGHEWRFVGTTSEISAGLAWRFSSL
jgi:opacity protein-like surface antigen